MNFINTWHLRIRKHYIPSCPRSTLLSLIKGVELCNLCYALDDVVLHRCRGLVSRVCVCVRGGDHYVRSWCNKNWYFFLIYIILAPDSGINWLQLDLGREFLVKKVIIFPASIPDGNSDRK